MDATKHNAVWNSNTAQGEIKVWADGGCIWPAKPADPGIVEAATYEPTEWDGDKETAWQVVAYGKVDGTLRFSP